MNESLSPFHLHVGSETFVKRVNLAVLTAAQAPALCKVSMCMMCNSRLYYIIPKPINTQRPILVGIENAWTPQKMKRGYTARAISQNADQAGTNDSQWLDHSRSGKLMFLDLNRDNSQPWMYPNICSRIRPGQVPPAFMSHSLVTGEHWTIANIAAIKFTIKPLPAMIQRNVDLAGVW